MRLVTFDQNAPRLGVWDGDVIIDPVAVLSSERRRRSGEHSNPRQPGAPASMIGFFTSGATGRGEVERAVEAARRAADAGDRLDGVHDRAGTRLLAPVPRPRRVRDYLTYRGHAAGSGLALPPAFEAMPICYQCNTESIVGPDEPLLWPSYTNQLDFELELGFFTGAGGRNIPVDQANGHIAGVTIFNDVSARDIQLFEMSMSIGPSKGKDFCTAMGPCVLTMDEVDEWNIALSASVNGEQWAAGTTQDRQFSFAEVLSWASYDEDVYPGEFFAIGTVGGGCGYELDRWIRPGDVVELSASGVGTLRNPVGQPEPASRGILPSFTGAPEAHATPH